MIDLLGYVYFFFFLDTWLSYVHSVTTRLFLRIKKLITWWLCIHIPSVILNGFFYIYTGATHHMTSNPAAFFSSSPYQGKSVVFTGDHTPLSISDIGTISLSSRSGNVIHLNDAMLVSKVSLSKNWIDWTTLWWSPKLCHLYSDFLCVVKDLHTHNVIALGSRP